MLSRIAEALYWIGRYVERAEDTARLSDVTYHHTLELGSISSEADQRHWDALISIAGDADRFFATHAVADDQSVLHFLTLEPDNPNSIIACISRARENARTMRHHITSEMWEALNRFYLELRRQAGTQSPLRGAEHTYRFYRSVKEFSHLFQGITDSTMPREEGWHFLQTGKFLERAEKTARSLDIRYHLLTIEADDPDTPLASRPEEQYQWLAVLRSLSAYEAYHKLYRSTVQPRAVVEMLTLSPVFPRSIRFSIAEVHRALTIIAEGAGDPTESSFGHWGLAGPSHEALRAAGRLHSALSYQRARDMFEPNLRSYLLDVQRSCSLIGEKIHEQYFAHHPLTAEEVLA